MELPLALRGRDNTNGFTYISIVKRLPQILRQMIDETNFDESVRNELIKLESDILFGKGAIL